MAALSRTARQAIGYAEAFAVLSGELTVPQAKDRTCARTRRLAKRQRTWFRHQLNAAWVDVTDTTALPELAEVVVECWREHGRTAIAP